MKKRDIIAALAEFGDVVEKINKVDIGPSGVWGVYAWEWGEIGFADEVKL